MRCLQHVLWRGAMALSLVVAGVGSAYGLYEPPVRSAQLDAGCLETAVTHGPAMQVKYIAMPGDGVRVVRGHG